MRTKSSRVGPARAPTSPRSGNRAVFTAVLLTGCLMALSPGKAPGQVQAPPPSGSQPSKETARALSLAGTVVPIAITVVSGATGSGGGALAGVLLMIPGPSLGHFYRGRPLRGLASMGMRAAGLFGLSAALAVCWNDCDGIRGAAAQALLGSGVVLFIGATVYDVTHAAEDVRRDTTGEYGARIVPLVDPGAGRAGLALNIRF